MKRILLLLFFYASVAASFAQSRKYLDSLFADLDKAPNDSLRLVMLDKVYENPTGIADSLSTILYVNKLETIAKRANDKKHLAKVNMVLGGLNVSFGHYEKADKYLHAYLDYCTQTKDSVGMAMANQQLGWMAGDKGNFEEAANYNLNCLKLAERVGDHRQIVNALCNMGAMFLDQQDSSNAMKYNLQALKIAEKDSDLNAVAAMCSNIAIIYRDHNNLDSAKAYLQKSIRLFEQIKLTFQLPRPCGVLAGVFFLQNQKDSAFYYIRKAIAIHQEHKEISTYTAGTYELMGNMFLEDKKTDSATYYLLMATQMNEQLGALRFLTSNYFSLANAYEKKGEYNTAYSYLQKATALKDSLFTADKSKIINELETKYQTGKKEQEILKQEEQIKRQRILSYSAVAVAIFFLLLIFFVYRSYQQKQKSHLILEEKNSIITKEKERSDELLLNILPIEVAEELKEKGTADAKHFDNVTVFFSDFKSFTTVSETLSPQQLVDELHECFSAFDNIMHKHNIEKIKTVGDAYLAVSGLPLANPNHAEDVVKAALEIQQFMAERKKQKESKAGLYEIRVGINSGSVVAGIVGVKKFAYDIWGDTVNTAARMEQNSEAGKINVSQTTYELVKDKFNCEYRGEIEAKNKGKLKMYFVT